MVNSVFFKKKKDFFTLEEVLKITESRFVNKNQDLSVKILGVAPIDKAGPSEISFINSGSYVKNLQDSKAGFCFLEEKYITKVPSNMIGLINPNPYFAYAQLLQNFYELKEEKISDISSNISQKAIIEKSAIIGAGAKIKSGVYIGHNVKIGINCSIGVNSVIMDNCQIGDNAVINQLASISYAIIGNNVIIHNGVAIGQDGFGFAHNKGVNHKILQLGAVIIGDNVEIGANSCIDRGALEDTYIGNGVKIDNLVQIAHNVVVGDGTVIAGCAAIAGSAKIGRFVQVGGGANISGHITISDGTKIAGMSGVMRDTTPMQIIGGIPALPIKQWHRLNVKLMQITKGNSLENKDSND